MSVWPYIVMEIHVHVFHYPRLRRCMYYFQNVGQIRNNCFIFTLEISYKVILTPAHRLGIQPQPKDGQHKCRKVKHHYNTKHSSYEQTKCIQVKI